MILVFRLVLWLNGLLAAAATKKGDAELVITPAVETLTKFA
jgi:hypothetical protein